MRYSRRILATLVVAAILGLASGEPLFAQHRPHAQSLPKRSDTHVYLMRGLFGIFSLGMDDLAGKLTQQGYRSSIYGWDSWEEVAATIAQRYDGGHRGPVVVIGHSLGANAVFYVSDRLDRRDIPVLLGVTFDATEPGKVPNNVAAFMNFWARDGFGHPVQAAPGYKGDLSDFDLSGQPNIDHTSIDALDQFHQVVLTKLDNMTSN